MDPKIWGWSLWQSLIHVAQGYPNNPTAQDRRHYYIFYQSLANILPCAVCQVNYTNHFKELPPKLNSKQDLLNWLHKLHNQTLKQMNKTPLSYTAFMKKYLAKCSSDNIFSTENCCLILCVLVLVVVAAYYFSGRTDSFPTFRG